MKTTLRVPMSWLKDIMNRYLEHHRLKMTYGGWVPFDGNPPRPFESTEQCWHNMLSIKPWSEAGDLFNLIKYGDSSHEVALDESVYMVLVKFIKEQEDCSTNINKESTEDGDRI